MELEDIIQAINSGKFDNDLDRLMNFIRSRKDSCAAVVAVSLVVGDSVRLKGLSTKYLNGVIGKVASLESRWRTTLRLLVEFPNHYQLRKYSGQKIWIPITCIEKIPPVPAQT